MKLILSPITRALAVCAFALALAAGALVERAAASSQNPYDYGQQNKDKDKDKGKAPQMSADEQKALQKIMAAPDAAAKLQAASEYAKKYTKSTERAKVVSYVAGHISQVQDDAQRISLLENMLTVFKSPADADVINPILIDSYVRAKRTDDAFRMAETSLAKNTNDITLLTQMAIVGIEEAKRGNPKFAQQAMQYGAKAIELIEGGKRPADFDDARWNEYQTRWLPQLYQSLGLVAVMMRKPDEAKPKLEKAASLNPNDPFTQILLGSLVNEEYQQLAEQYKMMNAGPSRDAKLKEAEAKLDQVIEFYARAIALSEGKPEYQKLHDQILEDLQSYYKYRHNNSTDGLQQLIDKYKKQ